METKENFTQMQFDEPPADPKGQTEGFFPGLEDAVGEPPEGFFGGGEPDFDVPEATAAPGAAAVVETERALPTEKKFLFDSEIVEERHKRIYNERISPTSMANILAILCDMKIRPDDSAMIMAHGNAHIETVLIKAVEDLKAVREAHKEEVKKLEQEVLDKANKKIEDNAKSVGKRTEQVLINLIEERIDSGTVLGRAKWAFFLTLGGFFFGQICPTIRPVASLFELIFTTARYGW